MEYSPAALDQAAAVDEAVTATTELGSELMGRSAGVGGATENSVISPASIAIVLAMLAEGADGPAADALDETLGVSGDDRSAAFGALQSAVLEFDGDPAVVRQDEIPERPLLHLANHIAVGREHEVGEPFLDDIARHYAADVSQVDFADDGHRVLDEWVSEHTGGLIEQSAIQPDPELVFVLQNAVLLAAQWENQFPEANTTPRDFEFADGSVAELDTMQQEETAAYTTAEGHQAVRLPYSEAFAMDVVLPEPEAGTAALDPGYWSVLDDELSGEPDTLVDLALPKVDVETDLPLVSALEESGLAPVLAGDSLDAIAPGTEIGQAEHQAVMTIDEEGTVAAAVTEAAGVVSAPPPPENTAVMHVDRPFALRIVHEDTGWPLFMGVIADPRG